ncbi:DUF4105 domain-containing protein [Sulfurimonas sp.]|uniref:Lnb N-terminal periplasmic domain-containing protein n=1 Tax=Sulfurimonas sp. TaxID=2022749 RepID=UPI0025D17EFC|nr:DUF4105 domain-containing protein [Sulfurimonas sp.]MDD5157629.1 DUF4105 domain-containing protein [Sulfurimonas sp.]
MTDLPKVDCAEYDKIVQTLNPKSITLVFPAAHVNSPASMFGHTFLRVNSQYDSKLLSYAVNYAADADPDKENAALFAIKGLFGGYFGKYSLMPYYEKLKEYRDSEQRDIWEYDLDLSKEETMAMVRHIWELNETRSYYYFFTQNCSYNMLWFLEVARPTLHLREKFNFQVIPFETVQVVQDENIVTNKSYRPSKRTLLLKYEELILERDIKLPMLLSDLKIEVNSVINDETIDAQQKKYILEASIELLQYKRSKNKIDEKSYIKRFHELSKARATLKQGDIISVTPPENPINGHRAIRAIVGAGLREGRGIAYLGVRPAYHDLTDSNVGYFRGTQIEFLDFELSKTGNKTELEKLTLLSIASLAQQSKFFSNFSWRTKFGWDKDLTNHKTNFSGTVGAGANYGGKSAYTYMMVDPLFYYDNGFKAAIGGSIGLIVDKYNFSNTKLEATKRFYDSGFEQNIFTIIQGFRSSKNSQVQFGYEFKDRLLNNKKRSDDSFRVNLNYYF